MCAAMLFGGGRRNNRQGESVAIEVDVDLADFYTGAEASREIRRLVVCRGCGGPDKSKKQSPKCSACSRCPDEIKMVRRNVGGNMFIEQQQRVPSEYLCRHENKKLTAVVERGVQDGAEVVFEHESEQRPGMIPGDVIFRLRARPHPRFTRDGDNLLTTVHLTLKEALVGFRRVLKHLDGHEVVLEHQGVTKPSEVRVVDGEGMPVHNFPSTAGNLVVTYLVRFPEALNRDQTEAIERLFA
jgi:DnaJ-class molecular chaperone